MTDPRGFAGVVKRVKATDRCYLYIASAWNRETRCALKRNHPGPCAIAVSPSRLPASSPTGAAAAQLAMPTASVQRQAVLEALATGDKTDEEIQTATGLDGDAERPRRWQLVKDHLVRDSGRMRKTLSGAWAVVWELVPE